VKTSRCSRQASDNSSFNLENKSLCTFQPGHLKVRKSKGAKNNREPQNVNKCNIVFVIRKYYNLHKHLKEHRKKGKKLLSVEWFQH
jgi:hypothetical protein